MSESTVLYEVKDKIATVTMNRPDRHNAMNYDLCSDVHAAMMQADADESVRVIVFTGAGKSFCVGADIMGIKASSSGAPRDPARNMGTLYWPYDPSKRPDFQATHTYFPMIGKPIISMINGAAAGVGLSYACFSDMRFAVDDASFAAAFVQRGLSAEWGMAWILPKLIGHGNASDFLLSGRKIKGQEARELGLVNRVYPREQLAEATYAYAREIATWCAPIALRLQKHQLWEAYFQSLGESNVLFKEYARQCATTEDVREAAASFLEKRPPVFKGR